MPRRVMVGESGQAAATVTVADAPPRDGRMVAQSAALQLHHMPPPPSPIPFRFALHVPTPLWSHDTQELSPPCEHRASHARWCNLVAFITGGGGALSGRKVPRQQCRQRRQRLQGRGGESQRTSQGCSTARPARAAAMAATWCLQQARSFSRGGRAPYCS